MVGYKTFLRVFVRKIDSKMAKKKVFNKSDKMQKNCGKCIKKI